VDLTFPDRALLLVELVVVTVIGDVLGLFKSLVLLTFENNSQEELVIMKSISKVFYNTRCVVFWIMKVGIVMTMPFESLPVS
jgi:hypothetical protein